MRLDLQRRRKKITNKQTEIFDKHILRQLWKIIVRITYNEISTMSFLSTRSHMAFDLCTAFKISKVSFLPQTQNGNKHI